jgi:hypothetical protein
MTDPVEAFVERVRAIQPLPHGSDRRVAIRQKITEFENSLRLDAPHAIPTFLQRARERVLREISRHQGNKAPTRAVDFFQEVHEELSLLSRVAIKQQDDDDSCWVEVQVHGSDGDISHVVKSNFYSSETARQWIDSDQGNTIIKAFIDKYEKPK